MTATIKRILPRSLLGRSLMIIVTPLIILQLVSASIFYETHWDKVTLRLARGVAGDIGAVIKLMRRNPEPENLEWIFGLAAETMELNTTFKEGAVLVNTSWAPDGLTERMLSQAMRSRVSKPFLIDSVSHDRQVII
ncbi:MAG: two-component sensor histidine kinase, partial [Rhodospirillales bacterium]|nr:two-component sensor histidine kinase [Rhodospirillales bacterium]